MRKSMRRQERNTDEEINDTFLHNFSLKEDGDEVDLV